MGDFDLGPLQKVSGVSDFGGGNADAHFASTSHKKHRCGESQDLSSRYISYEIYLAIEFLVHQIK